MLVMNAVQPCPLLRSQTVVWVMPVCCQPMIQSLKMGTTTCSVSCQLHCLRACLTDGLLFSVGLVCARTPRELACVGMRVWGRPRERWLCVCEGARAHACKRDSTLREAARQGNCDQQPRSSTCPWQRGSCFRIQSSNFEIGSL